MPCVTQSKNVFKNASNKRSHLAKTFNPFLPLAVQPQRAPPLQRARVISCRAAAEALFGILHGSITLLTRAWCSCLSLDLALVAASPITTGRKSIRTLIAIVTLLKLWQNLSSDSLWPSQSLLFSCFLSAERAGRMKDSWEGRESWMWTKSFQRNMRREFCPISFNKVVG